jgi:hypothetical protein
MTASGAMQLKHSPVHPRIIDNISERIVTVPDPSGSSMIIDILEHIAAEAPQVRERHPPGLFKLTTSWTRAHCNGSTYQVCQ